MAYLRPSSAYLRSVFAATETQTDPGLGWRNLLNDSVLNTLHKARDAVSAEKVQRRKQGDVRETLDKAFWQNVNTVRLNAGGSSNFVVAKDDLGNWYVKAMGSDPSAMIKAAKQLALYNTGARFNSNLLRVDELRERLDDKALDGDERGRAERELNGLTGTQGSAAATARATTLRLFQDNHNAQTLSHLKDLARRLQPNNEYFNAIVERWKTTFTDSGVDITKELVPLATGADVQKHMAQAQLAAVPPEEIAEPGRAIVDSLAALSRYRLSLRGSVLALATLSAAETTSVGNAESLAIKARDGRDTALKAVEDSTKLLSDATRRADEEKAKSPKDEARIRDTTKLADDAMRSATEKSLQLSAALATVKTAEDSLLQSRKLLAAANTRRDKAADDVDAVLRKDVDDRASDRLRAITEFESAIRVIGQSNIPS